ncbi:hypothetical protein GWK26_09985 [haloarchaeon 3A1-DGR]|nr:hypothetical protein GWK26_09985 [haloarchaeon 3A1-DGR]
MSDDSGLREDTAFNLIPTRLEDREYGLIDFLAIQICFGIAAWFFLTGGFTGMWVNLSDAIPIILFGNVVPLLLLSPLAVIFARYGVEQFIGTRAFAGHRGGDIFIFIYIASSFGFITYAALLFGRSFVRLINFWGGPEIISTIWPGASILAALATVIGAYIAWLGPRFLKWFMRASALTLMAIIFWFVIQILFFTDIPVWDLQPQGAPTESLLFNRAAAIELNAALGFSWAFWYGQWTRLSVDEKSAYHGCIWGWGILASTAGIFAALTALVVGSPDPTAWFLDVGTTTTVTLGLILFALANVSSIGALVYPMSITVKSRFPDINWTYIVILVALPGFILNWIPSVFSLYSTFLSFFGMLTAAYGGIYIGDFIINRGNYKLRALYDRQNGYRYWNGINFIPFVAFAFGCIFYLWTYNPVTLVSANGLFPYITAAIPTFVVSGLIHVVLTHLTDTYASNESVVGSSSSHSSQPEAPTESD